MFPVRSWCWSANIIIHWLHWSSSEVFFFFSDNVTPWTLIRPGVCWLELEFNLKPPGHHTVVPDFPWTFCTILYIKWWTGHSISCNGTKLGFEYDIQNILYTSMCHIFVNNLETSNVGRDYSETWIFHAVQYTCRESLCSFVSSDCSQERWLS